MEPTPAISCIESIGQIAGVVWQALSENGPMSMAKIVKAAGEPRDLVMQAIGWLAREGKLDIVDDRRMKVVSLR